MTDRPAARGARRALLVLPLVAALLLGALPSWAEAPAGEGVFTPTAGCAIAACGRGAALLGNGKVLSVRVGTDGGAELFDASNGTWAPTGACSGCGANTFGLTVTALLDGRALVAGGFNPAGFQSPPLATAYLYDPGAGTWARTGDMAIGRLNHSATLLPDGKVLVAGGCTTQTGGCGPTGGASATETAELFDPATGTWTRTGDMRTGHALHTATVLKQSNCGTHCGQVLVVGGVNSGSAMNIVEFYDPGAKSWSLTRTVQTPRFLHTAALLNDGHVFVVGNYSTDPAERDPRAEIFDAGAQTWAFATAPVRPVDLNGTSVILPNGKVLVVDGNGPQLYDPHSDSWSAYASGTGGGQHVEVLLGRGPVSACAKNCGSVLVAGGAPGPAFAELYTPRPAVSGVTPANGPLSGGTTVTISGTGLASATAVKFGSQPATSFAVDPATPDTTLTAVAPASSSGTVEVSVVGPGGTSVGGASFSFGSAATTTTTGATTAGGTTTTTAAPGGGTANGAGSASGQSLPTAPVAQAVPAPNPATSTGPVNFVG